MAGRLPTIDDVARMAGVGKGTASRVINGNPRVSADTRSKVLAAIDALNFRPSSMARRLSTRPASRQIGVLESFITAPAFVDRLRGIQEVIEDESGFDLLLFSGRSPERYGPALARIAEHRSVEALLVAGSSLTVMSGLRFVRHAAKLGWPGDAPVRWNRGDKQASYATPILATVNGQRQVFCLMRQGLVMLDPKTGKVNFSRWFRARVEESVNAANPVVVNDLVIISSAYYKLGAVLLRVLIPAGGEPGRNVSPAARVSEAFSLISRLVTNKTGLDAAESGYRVGLIGSAWLLVFVVAIAVPVGVGTAVYLEEYCGKSRWKSFVQMNIANLAGVPSIVYGLLGLILFQRGLGFESMALGPCLLAGALTLSLLILPVIVIATQEALRAVPKSLRLAALALGATRWQMIRDHLLPAASPGILTGTILGVSRAIGETAPLLMVGAAASLLKVPRGPFDRYTALPVEIYYNAKEPAEAYSTVAAGGILILLCLLLSMNFMAIWIRQRASRRSGSLATRSRRGA